MCVGQMNKMVEWKEDMNREGIQRREKGREGGREGGL